MGADLFGLNGYNDQLSSIAILYNQFGRFYGREGRNLGLIKKLAVIVS